MVRYNIIEMRLINIAKHVSLCGPNADSPVDPSGDEPLPRALASLLSSLYAALQIYLRSNHETRAPLARC